VLKCSLHCVKMFTCVKCSPVLNVQITCSIVPPDIV